MPFQVFVHTTKNLAGVDRARLLVRELANSADAPVELLIPAQNRWVRSELVSEEMLAETHATGGLSVRALSGLLSARLEWRSFGSRRELQHFLESSNHLQNLLYIAVENKHLELEGAPERFVDSLTSIVESIEANYAFGYGEDATRYDSDFGSAFGLSGGLRDIYPLNYYGPAFVELIDRRHLLNAPADVVRELRKGVLILPSQEFWRFTPELDEARKRIRDHFGEEYFVAGSPRRAGVQVGGVWMMIRALLEERRRTRARTPASRRPEFEWRGLVEGKNSDDEAPAQSGRRN